MENFKKILNQPNATTHFDFDMEHKDSTNEQEFTAAIRRCWHKIADDMLKREICSGLNNQKSYVQKSLKHAKLNKPKDLNCISSPLSADTDKQPQPSLL